MALLLQKNSVIFRGGDSPKGSTVVAASGKLVDDELRIPLHETSLHAVGVCYQKISAEGDTVDHDEVTAAGEVSGPHQRNDEVSAEEG